MDNNYRRQPQRSRRQTVDGFINAPARPQLASQQFGKPMVGSRRTQDDFRTATRRVGDFKQGEGYHPTNTPLATGNRPTAGAQQSLKATLPGPRTQRRRRSEEQAAEKKRDWRKIRTWSLRGGLAFLGVLILIGGFLFAKGYFKVNKVFKGGGSAASLNANVDPTTLKGEGDGRVNILLTGKGGEGHAGADLTDTILVASVDPIGHTAGLVSVPRDMWVTTSSGSTKINAVYAQAKAKALRSNPKDEKRADEAGIKALQNEVNNVLGIPIHYYATVDFMAFQKAVDTVGGVDIQVPEELAVTEKLWDPVVGKNYYLDVDAGKQHFDGQRALFFARSRHTSTRGDFDRSERQRLFIAALSQKVLSANTFTNPVRLSKLMDNFGDHVTTDLSINDAVRLGQIGKQIGGKIDSIDLADRSKPLVKTGMISGQSVVMPAAGIGDYSEIQSMIRTRLRDGYLAKENATVSILNGTSTSGLAGKKAEELRAYGYTIGTVGDAPTQVYTDTVIVDLTKGKKPYTKNYLQKRFKVKVVTKLPDQAIQPGNASFVIILGSNETTDL
jgi:LCP family protein required for cell wall assembly